MKVNYNSLEEDWQLGSHWLCSWGGTPWKNCGSTGSTGLLDLRALCPSGTKVTKLVPDGTLDFLGNKILLCFTKSSAQKNQYYRKEATYQHFPVHIAEIPFALPRHTSWPQKDGY